MVSRGDFALEKGRGRYHRNIVRSMYSLQAEWTC